jgi:arylsulfatase A-like enzyme
MKGSVPNLLYIVCDEMREMAMSCSGNPNIQTPNLDRLAASGFRSTRMYTTSPVCCPARATMQTGMYPHNAGFPDYNNGMHLREDVPTIAEILSERGYQTCHIGKWHLNGKKLSPGNRYVPPEYHRGYEEWLGFEHGHDYFGSVHYAKDDTQILPPGNQYEPDFQTDRAVQFIETNARRPWMMHLSWGPPHFPLTQVNVPADVLATFDPEALTLRGNVDAGQLPRTARMELAIYYAMIRNLDTNLGRLLDTLDELSIRDKTIIVFTSDHGDKWLGCRPLGGNHVKNQWRAVRTRTHMACWVKDAEKFSLVHLFDMTSDPLQQNDLRDDIRQAGTLAELTTLLEAHLEATGDRFRL